MPKTTEKEYDVLAAISEMKTTLGRHRKDDLYCEAAISRAYREGFKSACRMLAIWNDGEQTVGVQRRPLQAVLDEVDKCEHVQFLHR